MKLYNDLDLWIKVSIYEFYFDNHVVPELSFANSNKSNIQKGSKRHCIESGQYLYFRFICSQTISRDIQMCSCI